MPKNHHKAEKKNKHPDSKPYLLRFLTLGTKFETFRYSVASPKKVGNISSFSRYASPFSVTNSEKWRFLVQMDFPVTNRWLFFGFKMLISQGAQKTSMSGNGQTAGVAKLISSLETISKGDFHGNFHPRSKNWYQKNHQHIILEHHVISISRQYQVTTNSPPKTISPTFFTLSHLHHFVFS